MKNKPRRPWIAALLTILMTGLGHVYAGNPKRGLLLFSIWLSWAILSGALLIAIPNIFIIIIFLIGGFAFLIFCIADAYLIAKANKEQYELTKYNRWFVYVGYFVILSLISALLSAGVKTNAFNITSGSMEPTLLVGESILVNEVIYGVKIPLIQKTIIPVTRPKRDDLVVFIFPKDRSMSLIKRVIGVAGDKIEIVDKKIFINDKEYNDTHGVFKDDNILPRSEDPRDNFGPVIVPENSIFVMGDNRDESLDSRYWGFVDLRDVEGKALIIYWSWDSDEHKPRWERLGITFK
ncbi:MAG TPA: signal peptidase I [Smithella sp.]|nr:signal peptidase I [Smithella sp.]